MSASSFAYKQAKYRYVRNYADGKWSKGRLSEDARLVLNESACVFQYAQACFEGLKAYRNKEGRILTFRPDLNAQRMKDSCERMVMPIIPVDEFIEAVDETVLANEEILPDCADGSSLYIRPFMIGSSPTLGVGPSEEFEFRIFVSPVGAYFAKETKSLSLKISDFDRAAPKGTGQIKAGINYGMSLYPLMIAHEEGYDENLYLDPQNHNYVEETGGANIFFVDEYERIIVPKSDSILPSITRRSLIELSRDFLGYEVIERKVSISEISSFKECGLCGTAAVIAPVGSIDDHGKVCIFDTSEDHYGKTCKKIRETLIKIQHGEMKGPDGWVHVIR